MQPIKEFSPAGLNCLDVTLDCGQLIIPHLSGTLLGLLRIGTSSAAGRRENAQKRKAGRRWVSTMRARTSCEPMIISVYLRCFNAAWAAANRATGTRKGEQLT